MVPQPALTCPSLNIRQPSSLPYPFSHHDKISTDYSATDYSATDHSATEYLATDYSATDYLATDFSSKDYSSIDYLVAAQIEGWKCLENLSTHIL